MGFLRRLFRGGEGSDADASSPPREPERTPQQLDDDERSYERELARFEQERLDDLRLRQLRYADRSWTPPSQGGAERADDADRARAED